MDYPGRKQISPHLVYFVFFALSGAAALMYEVVWIRQFARVLGASSYAVTIVLATFMAGLGLGSWAFGKTADRLGQKRLARAYLALEVGIGIYALLLPVILGWAEGVYVRFYQGFHPSPLVFNGFRLLLTFLLLVLPTTCIGATLPVLSRYIIRRQDLIPVTVSQLYAANTLGAVAGTVLAGYVFLPRLGIGHTTAIAAALNFLVAAGFWLVNGMAKAPQRLPLQADTSAVKTAPAINSIQKTILFAFFISGIAAMCYEVAWTRTLAMILGTTTFAFTTMLATFLVGISLGSAFYGVLSRWLPGTRLFVLLQFAATFSVLVSIPLFEKLPLVFLSLHHGWIASWEGTQLVRFMLAASVMLVPTFALGMLLPAMSDLFIARTEHLGQRLGQAYGMNTLGNVIGAVAAGLFLVPFFGMQKTITIGATINLAAGCMVILCQSGASARKRILQTVSVSLAAAALIWIIAPWAPRVMNSGVYIYAPRYRQMLQRYQDASAQLAEVPRKAPWEILEMSMNQYDLLYYNPGVTATVAVMERNDGVRFLTIDGKTDASTGQKSDMKTQVMIGQLPLLFHENPDKVLVVGLGSGITAGSVLTHDVRVVDCAEISPSVIEAAGYFSHANHRALDDPRLKTIPRDARNLLLTTEENYDIVISQPSNPWISGESSLFSLEWYRLVHEKLKSGGLFLQWVPAYLIAEQDMKIIVHTLRSVFPHLTVWTSGSVGDLIFLAKKGAPLEIDYPLLRKRLGREAVQSEIRRVGLDPFLLLFELFVMDENELSVYLYSDLKRPLPQNTDDLPVTEFSTPKQLIRQEKVSRFASPEHLHGNPESLLKITRGIDLSDIRRMMEQKMAREKRDGIQEKPRV